MIVNIATPAAPSALWAGAWSLGGSIAPVCPAQAADSDRGLGAQPGPCVPLLRGRLLPPSNAGSLSPQHFSVYPASIQDNFVLSIANLSRSNGKGHYVYRAGV